MIPLARDARPMVLWRAVSEDDDGDVTERWEPAEGSVLVSEYPLASLRTQTEDGQVVQDQRRLFVSCACPEGISTGDRLGTCDGPLYHLVDVKVSKRHASCIGVRI